MGGNAMSADGVVPAVTIDALSAIAAKLHPAGKTHPRATAKGVVFSSQTTLPHIPRGANATRGFFETFLARVW